MSEQSGAVGPADGTGRPHIAGPRSSGAGRSTARGDQTRQLILDTAMRLFRERGYAQTTMRAIAQEAGVAVGNAYYYFASKEHLIQGFYRDTEVEIQAAARPVLDTERAFVARLRGVLHGGIDVLSPSHEFATSFFKTAAEPTSPLSPFSAESTETRVRTIGIFAEVLDGSSVRVDRELRPMLPELLWLAWLGVVLFWVHDRSPDQVKTRRLIDGAAPLIDRLVRSSHLPLLRPVTRELLDLLRVIRP
ncbi:TetR family transcriptional regulator [Plantactinospora sp. GCM10030261]|uniref:TetR family transcriptional regulator n=1 Tax=Plantactinospora sp. GCM10030261 TaxID=3273420 RepID=UPI003605EBD1